MESHNATGHGPQGDDMKTTSGSLAFTFSDMVRDTIAKHGFAWAFDYYVIQHGIPEWEFNIFAGPVIRITL